MSGHSGLLNDLTTATSKQEFVVVSTSNGYAGLQVALRSDSAVAVGVHVIAPHFDTAALTVRTYRVGMVNVTSHPTDKLLDQAFRPELGFNPDPLFPLETEIALKNFQRKS